MYRYWLALCLLFGASLHAQTLSVSQTAAHACSIHAGAVRCWGTQPNGGLGNVLDEANKQVEVTGISNAIAVGVGNSHSCALISGGTMRCWGRGSEGQLGNAGNPVVQRTPVNVTGLAGAVTAIAVADFTTCALISGGAVQCFGFDGSGELGNDAPLTASSVPVAVSGIGTAQEISAGSRHFCVRLGDATARCWGSNSAGQLGDNSSTSRSTPVAVSGLSGSSTISAAQFHTCAATASGTKCWGNNLFGQLGTGNFTPSATPIAVSAVSGTITLLRAGGRHTCAQTSTTAISCFGRNFDGQLSQSNNSGFSPIGVVMQGLPELAISEISVGTASTCVRFAEEDIRCVGSGSLGQLGDGTLRRWKSPVLARYDPTAKLSLGAQRTCSKIGSAQPQCLGFNGFGGLGDGTTERRLSLVTVSGTSPSANSALTSSESQTCLFNNGTNALFTRCWGRNDTRQLGLASNGDQLTAVQAPAFIDGRLIAEMTFGTFFGCAILEDIDINIPITVRCWSSNAQGQLGDGTTVDKFANQSVDIVGLNDPRQVVAGRAHACVREFLGTVKCWGSDTSGELGDGAAVGPVGVPVTVTGLSNVVSLAVSRDGSHTCALLNDGSARCWGANLSGQLGNGNTSNQNAPVMVSGSHVFNQLITGISHSCGRLTNGEVRCWGSNQLDQLGVAAVFLSNTPVVVDGLNANVTQLIGGPLFNCALQSSAWKCWGYNSSGELGNGIAAVALLPVQVQTPNILLSDGFE